MVNIAGITWPAIHRSHKTVMQSQSKITEIGWFWVVAMSEPSTTASITGSSDCPSVDVSRNVLYCRRVPSAACLASYLQSRVWTFLFHPNAVELWQSGGPKSFRPYWTESRLVQQATLGKQLLSNLAESSRSRARFVDGNRRK